MDLGQDASEGPGGEVVPIQGVIERSLLHHTEDAADEAPCFLCTPYFSSALLCCLKLNASGSAAAVDEILTTNRHGHTVGERLSLFGGAERVSVERVCNEPYGPSLCISDEAPHAQARGQNDFQAVHKSVLLVFYRMLRRLGCA